MKKLLVLTFLLNIFAINAKDKLDIVTTNFPNYEFVREIGGEKVEVEILLPFGIEPHSYEPSPKDIVKMNKADLLVYTNEEMEPWVKKVEKSLKVETLNVSKNLHLDEGDCDHEDHNHDEDEEHHDHDHENHEEDDHSHDHHHDDHDDHDTHDDKHDDHDDHNHSVDPHVWTDPFLVLEIIDTIVDELGHLDPENKDYYVTNGKRYKDEINKLHKDLKELSEYSKRDTIVFTGHSVFGYFSKRYHIDFVSPYKSFSPNSEPSAKDVASLRKYIKENNIEYIYYEELVTPKIATLLEKELSVKTLLLHGVHNVSKKEFNEGVTYLSIMKDNIERLKLGLEYER